MTNYPVTINESDSNLWMSAETLNLKSKWVHYRFGGTSTGWMPDWLKEMLGYNSQREELISEIKRLHEYTTYDMSDLTEQKSHEYLPIDDFIFTLTPEQITKVQAEITEKSQTELDLFVTVLGQLYDTSWAEYSNNRDPLSHLIKDLRIFYWFD